MTIPSPGTKQFRCPTTLHQWATYLRALAEPIINPLDLAAEFDRARAKPFMLNGPLLLHLLQSERLGNPSQFQNLELPETPTAIRAHPEKYPDLYCWWALLDPTLDPLRVVDLTAAAAIVPQALCTTIEVWTETELATIHALTHQLTRNGPARQTLHQRLQRALEWHNENTQPDNATNHPWAVQAFLQAGTPEAQHYAETLLNNCQVQNARPDPLSAWILIDAAIALVDYAENYHPR